MSHDTDCTQDPVCPHCGKPERDSWENGMCDGDQEVHECGHCGESFKVECRVSRTFTTEKA